MILTLQQSRNDKRPVANKGIFIQYIFQDYPWSFIKLNARMLRGNVKRYKKASCESRRYFKENELLSFSKNDTIWKQETNSFNWFSAGECFMWYRMFFSLCILSGLINCASAGWSGLEFDAAMNVLKTESFGISNAKPFHSDEVHHSQKKTYPKIEADYASSLGMNHLSVFLPHQTV